MQRRKLIIAAGSAMTTVVAGCSSDESSSSPTESSTPTENSTPTETASADDNLESAAVAIQNANDAIATQSDKLSDPSVEAGAGVDIQASSAERYLDTATSELDMAEEVATSTQQDTIAAARSWISYSRSVIEFLNLFADGYSEFTTGLTYIEAERYSDSAESFKTAEGTLSDADSKLTIVRDRSDSLVETDSEYFDDVNLTSSEAEIDELEPLLSSFISLSNGMHDVTLGLEDFISASNKLQNGQYSEGVSGYNDAQSHASSAENTFKDLEQDAPNSIKNSVIEYTCYAGALAEAAGHFATGSRYYANGNSQAGDEEFNMGQNALNQCDFEA